MKGVVLLCLLVLANAQDPMERARKLVAEMTLQEKLAMVHGYDSDYVGSVNGIPRLKIPELHLEDGPQGIADGVHLQTCFPSALTVVATWDEGLMELYGQALGREQRGKGTNIMLGPMINIARVPMSGRNFESFGEDPYLTSRMVVPSVRGIQSQGVMACAKHFIDNNQEINRTLVSENVPERAQWEIYYPAFQAAVNAGVGSIMCSYNKINNTYACENEETLNRDLKGKMGFKGFVMSDWGATHSTVKAANGGLDMQMPDEWAFGPALAKAVASGQVPESRITDMALRIIYPMFAVGLFDYTLTGNLTADVQSQAHTLLARKLATHANILAKNQDGILPIKSTIRKIAVLGDDGQTNPFYAGGGSGHVIPSYVVTPFEGISKRAGSGVQVTYAPTLPATSAAALAKDADIAIVCVGVYSSEGMDRPDLGLGGDQDKLVEAVAAANPNTIVVSHGPGSVLMPWIDKVKAVVLALYPGQEDGNALASVLFGDYNPSGKLPLTFAKTQKEIPVNTEIQWPGIDNQSNYTENLLVGYRWYDQHNVAPLFPFGHGLSYTTFTYSDLKITNNPKNGVSVSVTAVVKNTGDRHGAEVAQMYITYPTSAGEPPKSLRGFKKFELSPGQSQNVTFDAMTGHAFSIFDDTRKDWKFVPGKYVISVGSSSRDIRLSGDITL